MHTFIPVRVINNLLSSNKMSGINWASITLQQRNPSYANNVFCTNNNAQYRKRVDLYDENYIAEVFGRETAIKKSIYRMEIFPYAISERNARCIDDKQYRFALETLLLIAEWRRN